MRIFIGLTEIGNIAATYAKGFHILGHETYTVVLSRHPFYPDSQYNFVIDEKIGAKATQSWAELSILPKMAYRIKQSSFAMREFLTALSCCDIFIFMFGSSFLPEYLDYPTLKYRKKNLVSVFLGSDIRYGYALEQEMGLLGLAQEVQPFIDYVKSQPGHSFYRQLKKIQAAEKYADLILSQPGYGQLQTRPFMRMNIPLDLSQLCFKVTDRAIPLVLHAPSKRGVKGTEYVLAVVEQLKQEGIPFEFRLIENMANSQLRELLSEADIVVDELFSDTVGVLSSEAMASGNAVLVRYMQDYAGVPSGCPAINVTKDTLANHLRQVILDRDLRQQLSYAGRPYVETHNDHIQIAQQILDWLQPNGIKKYDFVPLFYKNFKIPPEILKIERQEKLSQLRQMFIAK
jgi:hypothetical protein